MKIVIAWIVVSYCTCVLAVASAATEAIPHLAKQGTAAQLIVDGKPFLILGGELGNSAATTLTSIDAIWPRLVELNLNTVLVPVYWDLIEPREGEFDFELVDGILAGARKHQLRLVLLWFGSWKNSMSCYAPAWVKTDQARFPRSVGHDGRGMEILSPFSEANLAADTAAFTALMKHLRQIDGKEHTVLMIQVENEIGMIPAARDWSKEATTLYQGQVPRELMDHLEAHKDSLFPELRARWAKAGFKHSGTWEQVFGPGLATEEIFTAWYFGRYTEHVAAAGKAEYPLPMYVNAALIRPNYPPGRYPSGGPLPHLIDVWQSAAPSLDFLAPDIYFPNFVEWCRKFRRRGNPLFIPESLPNSRSAAKVFYAIGQEDAIGVSPFAIDQISDPGRQPLRESYEILRQLAPRILAHQGRGTIVGVAPDVPFAGAPVPTEEDVKLGDYMFHVVYEKPKDDLNTPGLEPGEWLSGGIIIQEGPDEYLVAGTGIILTFTPVGSPAQQEQAGILNIENGRFVDSRWQIERYFGGDESHQGRHLRIPPGQFGIQRMTLYRYR
jgi:Domain of unknown function (DUF5597)/Beta-galactosidase